MAKTPKKSILSIFDTLRGNPVIKNAPKTVAHGQAYNISTARRDDILKRGLSISAELPRSSNATATGLENLLGSTFITSGTRKIENKQILSEFPDIAKAARLVIASQYSPTDLSQAEIAIDIRMDDPALGSMTALQNDLSAYYQKRLNLKTMGPRWSYRAAFESGAVVLVVVPQESIATIAEGIGAESMAAAMETCDQTSFWGFTNNPTAQAAFRRSDGVPDLGIESIVEELSPLCAGSQGRISSETMHELVADMIGTEALDLTDNMASLQMASSRRERQSTNRRNKFRQNLRPKPKQIVALPGTSPDDKTAKITGDPIMMEIPAEAVTPLIAPGEPEDPVAIIVLLDEYGAPIKASNYNDTSAGMSFTSSRGQTNLFQQVYQAYGIADTRNQSDKIRQDTLYQIYESAVSKFVLGKARNAGFDTVDIGSADSVFRCMFHRFMAAQKTRLLLIPKEYFTYFAYDIDENGIGVSRLEGVKMFLSMRMVVLVSRILAAINAATNNRDITVAFTDDAMVQPEAVYQRIVAKLAEKNLVDFSTIDPNAIQTSMQTRGISIHGQNIPGFQQFDLQNTPSQRGTQFDFDPQVMDYLDKQTNAAMRVPASAMQSLDENDFARSLTTTNLFFSMDIAMDQDIVIEKLSDFLQKYSYHSEPIRNIIQSAINSKRGAATIDLDRGTLDDAERSKGNLTVDEIISNIHITLPRVNLAPTKSQFDILDQMTTSVTNMLNAVLPDDIAGDDANAMAATRALRAYLIQENLRDIMSSTGMSEYRLPGDNFQEDMLDIGKFKAMLANLGIMIKNTEQVDTGQPESATSDPSEMPPVTGYGDMPTDTGAPAPDTY